MKRLLDMGMISLSMSLSFLLARFVTISFGFVLISFAASTKHYEVGNVYTYDYVLGLELNEPSVEVNPLGSTSGDVRTGSTVGYKILSQVEVKPVWQNEPGGSSILEIQLLKPQLQIKSRKAPQPEGFRDHSSNLDSVTQHSLFVHWKDGQIKQTFSVKNDDTSLVNIKKGIANILQIRSSAEDTEIIENTPAGKCKVQYNTIDAFHFSKTIRGKCDTSGANYFFRTHNNPVLGSEIESEINSTVSMARDAGVVGDVEVSEVHVVRVTAKKEVGARIQASQSFKLSGTSSSSNVFQASTVDAAVQEIAKAKGVQLISDDLFSKPEKIPYCEAPNCKTLDDISQSLTPETLATTKMSSAFLQMVSRFREAKIEEIKPQIKSNLRIFPQILDVCAATGRHDIHEIVMKVLNFQSEEETVNPERYLLGLALSPSPTPEILQDLFKLLKRTVPSIKLQESLILTTAAIAHTIAEKNRKEDLPQSRLVLEIEEYLLNSFQSCDGETIAPCRELYIRSLKNLKSKSTVPLLFDLLVEGSNQKTNVVVMKSIHAMPDSYIELKYRPTLLKIIQQIGKKYDSSVRTLALDVILRNYPTKDELRQIAKPLLEKVVDKQHADVTTFMWHRLHEFSETNPLMKSYLLEIIQEEQMNTYHHLSPRGLSTAFTRVFTSNPSGNSSFSNALEMSGKMLKRSLFDVFVKSNYNSVQLLSLGIFTDGLASFTNEDENAVPDEDEEEATAGMELTLMEVQSRPLVFFVGKGELMGLVWSGAGSERTSAIQGNVLLQDDKKVIPLFNGLVADVNIQGGLSFDLAGQVQMSLWHRTANSLVENKGGLVLQSVVRADTSFVKSRVDYTVAVEAALHFTSDINFYQGVMMCHKLTQPEFRIRQNIHKTERIPGSKHKLRKAKYKTTPVPGITYALNKKNSELCSVMYKDEL